MKFATPLLRRRRIFLIFTLTVIGLMLDSYISHYIMPDFNFERTLGSFPGNLIDTEGCSLPTTLLYPHGFYMKKDLNPYCDDEKRIVSIDDEKEILYLTRQRAGDGDLNPCSVVEIIRNSENDTFAYGASFNINNSLDIRDKELFITKCENNINFDAHFPVNPEILEKINFWKKFGKNRPISILFLGFDSTSRSNFHRSLKTTMPLLNKMGFVDFKGYHTIAPATLDNFFAFLMGLTAKQVRESCAPDWTSPFDNCPFIWKIFHQNKFITAFMEDGAQSFNWGGQAGFTTKNPTDYYPHPLFGSIKDYRKNNSNGNNTNKYSCLSTLNAPNFLLQYTKRFLKKFSKTPTFSMTWFSDPFHDNTYSLYGIDEKLFEFFTFLNSENEEAREIRRKTMIILMGDHGERNGDFVHRGIEGYIERLLPGLFIRLPEDLLEQFPHLKMTEYLQINTEHLTSGFDIHHTLLHLLKLQGLEFPGGVGEFSPVLKDRSSLLLPVSDQRTCKEINIAESNCMCGVNWKHKENERIFEWSTPPFAEKLLGFCVEKLNSLMHESNKYSNSCVPYEIARASLSAVHVIEEYDEFARVVVRFSTRFGGSKADDFANPKFDVLLKITKAKGEKEIKDIQMISKFGRINRYKEQSWCIGFKTDEDRMLKEICYCKVQRPKK